MPLFQPNIIPLTSGELKCSQRTKDRREVHPEFLIRNHCFFKDLGATFHNRLVEVSPKKLSGLIFPKNASCVMSTSTAISGEATLSLILLGSSPPRLVSNPAKISNLLDANGLSGNETQMSVRCTKMSSTSNTMSMMMSSSWGHVMAATAAIWKALTISSDMAETASLAISELKLFW